MKKIIASIICLLSFSSLALWAAGGNVHLDHAAVDLSNQYSLQRGAKYYINYCLGCHSLAYQRYNRMAKDLGLSEREVEENLIFTSNDKGIPTKVGELMTIAMDEAYARKAFNDIVPPDLSLTARAKGADWIYTYLRTFYLDDSRPMGVNNTVIENVGMPHVLWELQGWQQPVYKTVSDDQENTKEVITGFTLVKPGKLSLEEYDQLVLDITNFLVYVSEPAKLIREQMGVWVILFLVLFTLLAYLLKREYWKDVH